MWEAPELCGLQLGHGRSYSWSGAIFTGGASSLSPFGNGSLDVLRSGSSSSSSRADALTRSLPGVNPPPSGPAPDPNNGVHGLGLPGIPVDAPPGEVDMEVFKSRPEVRSRILW